MPLAGKKKKGGKGKMSAPATPGPPTGALPDGTPVVKKARAPANVRLTDPGVKGAIGQAIDAATARRSSRQHPVTDEDICRAICEAVDKLPSSKGKPALPRGTAKIWLARRRAAAAAPPLPPLANPNTAGGAQAKKGTLATDDVPAIEAAASALHSTDVQKRGAAGEAKPASKPGRKAGQKDLTEAEKLAAAQEERRVSGPGAASGKHSMSDYQTQKRMHGLIKDAADKVASANAYSKLLDPTGGNAAMAQLVVVGPSTFQAKSGHHAPAKPALGRAGKAAKRRGALIGVSPARQRLLFQSIQELYKSLQAQAEADKAEQQRLAAPAQGLSAGGATVAAAPATGAANVAPAMWACKLSTLKDVAGSWLASCLRCANSVAAYTLPNAAAVSASLTPSVANTFD